MKSVSIQDIVKLTGADESDLKDAAKKRHLVYQAVIAENLNKRQGTAKTKTRTEVRGGGRKPFKQKGTGSARQGSANSPLNPGGGQAHGPVPRDWNFHPNKKEQKIAFKGIFAERILEGKVSVLAAGKWVKSSECRNILPNKERGYALIVASDLASVRGMKNFPRTAVDSPLTVSVRDLVRSDYVLFADEASISQLKSRLGA